MKNGKIFKNFSPMAEETVQIQIDSTYVKAHQHSAGAKKGGLKRRGRQVKRRFDK